VTAPTFRGARRHPGHNYSRTSRKESASPKSALAAGDWPREADGDRRRIPMRPHTAAAAVSATALALAAAAGPAAAEGRALITVTGEGRVEAAPDMATITLGVTSEAETARAAMDEASGKVSALLATLRAAGIEARDVQTSGLALNPVWDHRGDDEGGPPRIVGFSAQNTVTVRVRALDALGALLDRVLDAGTNTFNGLTFGFREPRPLEDEARRRAVADARAKAELLTAAAGVGLGPIVSISEAGYAPPMPDFRMAAAADSVGAVPVAAGEMSVTVSVTVVWEIVQAAAGGAGD
jgi:uncharacterized protein YggE